MVDMTLCHSELKQKKVDYLLLLFSATDSTMCFNKSNSNKECIISFRIIELITN